MSSFVRSTLLASLWLACLPASAAMTSQQSAEANCLSEIQAQIGGRERDIEITSAKKTGNHEYRFEWRAARSAGVCKSKQGDIEVAVQQGRGYYNGRDRDRDEDWRDERDSNARYFDVQNREWRDGSGRRLRDGERYGIPRTMDYDYYWDVRARVWRQSSRRGEVCRRCTPSAGFPNL